MIARIFIVLTLVATSCSPNFQNKFENKVIIGLFSEHEGFDTYEGMLFSDSTFWINNGTWGQSQGNFNIEEDSIYFTTLSDIQYLQNKYIIQDSAQKLIGVDTLYEWLNFEWINSEK